MAHQRGNCMNVIECPQQLREFKLSTTNIFLAGGITNCPDWQKEMIERFKDVDDITLVNPRRSTFDINNPAESDYQIEWEFSHLHLCDAILFWFPYQTLCPITLYELGVHADAGKEIFVGCHPAYQRKFDVEKQISLINPSIKVHDNFADLVDEIKVWLPHTDNDHIDSFASIMKHKMLKSRLKGRHGWDDPSLWTVEFLEEGLRHHIEKGDVVDIANYCMMLFQRGCRYL